MNRHKTPSFVAEIPLETSPAGLTQVLAVAGGGHHSLALKADGSVAAWGNNTYGQCTVPAGLNLKLRFKVPGHSSMPPILNLLLDN